MSSIFTKIINREIPGQIIAEDENYIAFLDIVPLVMGHTLIVPKKHIHDIHSIAIADREVIGHLFFVAKTIAARKGLEKNGYRMVINNGRDAGQTVFHIHLHLMAGRVFSWPPG